MGTVTSRNSSALLWVQLPPPLQIRWNPNPQELTGAFLEDRAFAGDQVKMRSLGWAPAVVLMKKGN